MQFDAAVSACVDGRTTRAKNVEKIDVAADELGVKLGVIEPGQELSYDMLRIPGPAHLMSEGKEATRPEFYRESFTGYCKALVDMHHGEVHIISGHTRCGMECGNDVHDPELSYRHLHKAILNMQRMFNESFDKGEQPCGVTVAGILIHVDETCIVAVETFTAHEIASFMLKLENGNVNIARHMVSVLRAERLHTTASRRRKAEEQPRAK